MEEQLIVLVDPWQDKYERLLIAHEKLLQLNQCLEDKLLNLAEEREAAKIQNYNQIQDLTQRLVEARLCVHQLEDENERYQNDINVVIQLLHCKPTNFISPKIETLPDDLQRKVLGQRNSVGPGRKEKKIIKVQVPTFPPTDIMYAVDKGGRGYQQRTGGKDIVSAAIMAKVLQERENERKENQQKRCHCTSRILLPTLQKETQTLPSCTISYSDFPYTEESTKITTKGKTTIVPINDDRKINIFCSKLVDDVVQTNINHNTTRNFDTYNYHGDSQEKISICRETSFIHPQSSFSSSSSPTSSTTSNSYSSSIHQSHENSTALANSGILLDLSYNPSENSSLQSVSNVRCGEKVVPGPETKLISALPKPDNRNAIKKVAGHCVRVIDDTDLMDDSLYNDKNTNSGCFSNGPTSHWRNTILVQPPPKSLSSHDSLSWFMTVSPPPLYSSLSASSQPLPSALLTSSFSSSANDPSVGSIDLVDSTDSVVTSSSSFSSIPSGVFSQSSESSSSQQNINPLNNYYGMSHHRNGLISPFTVSSQHTHQSHQYYRAQKRAFWTRSSSTTSTETEI